MENCVGVWTLRSFVMENVDTRERSEPFGSEPRGTLVLHPEGRMVALVTPQDRAPPTTEAEQAAAFQRTIAYSGRYRLEPPDRLVTTVDVAGFPGWVGTDQVRILKLEGERLDIITPPGFMPRPGGAGVTVIGILSFVREAPANG